MRQINTTVKFDMRAPDFGTPPRELYGAALEMARFADDIGATRINLMEHHGSDDGYLPTPFVMGGGVAAVTRKCRVTLGAVILPLHDPVKIAEQIAVLDLMSGGRLEVILGAGYVVSEFEAFGVSMSDRGRLLDEGIEIILRALHGERFHVGGREVFVRPLPVRRPEDILFVGGGVAASARRAARFGLGLAPMRRGLSEIYASECRDLGREPGLIFEPTGIGDIHLSLDPEQSWTRILPHLKHMVGEYAKLAETSGADSPFRGLLTDDAALRRSGMLNMFTPDQMIERAQKIDATGSLTFMPLLGGLAPEIGWKSLKLLADAMPRLQVSDQTMTA